MRELTYDRDGNKLTTIRLDYLLEMQSRLEKTTTLSDEELGEAVADFKNRKEATRLYKEKMAKVDKYIDEQNNEGGECRHGYVGACPRCGA